MPGNIIETAEEAIKISDPGEINRDQHNWADRFVIRVGQVAAWLFPILMVAIVTQVIIRKFGFNQAWLDDAQWWIYGAAMLAAFGYSITTESHVRVDILHQFYSDAKKAKIEIFALGWLLLPFLILMTDVTMHYAASSWVAGEGSDSANGLHKLYLLKALIPVLFGVAIIATLSVLYRHLCKLTQPILWKYLIAALPGFLFFMDRLTYYAFWWYTRFSQPELKTRRIPKQDIFDNTLLVGMIVGLLILALVYLASRRSNREA